MIHSIPIILSINRMENGNYFQESSQETPREASDIPFDMDRFHHLIWELQRGHGSFETLRQEVVPWAKRILLDNGVDITKRNEAFSFEPLEAENADPISTEKPVDRREHTSKRGKLPPAESPENMSAT